MTRRRRRDRGVSDVIGYVLVFSLVASVVAIVSVTGVGALEDARFAEQVNNAERAYDVLADNLDDVHREGAPSRATEINLQDARLDTTTNATINVSGRGGGVRFSTGNQTTNAIRWQSTSSQDTVLSYELGTVIRDEGPGAVLVREGPYQFDRDWTIISLVLTPAREQASYSGSTVRVRGIRLQPNIRYRGTAPDTVYVNVTTRYPDTWAEYFESQPDTTCTRAGVPRPGKEMVQCELTNREKVFVSTNRVEVEVER